MPLMLKKPVKKLFPEFTEEERAADKIRWEAAWQEILEVVGHYVKQHPEGGYHIDAARCPRFVEKRYWALRNAGLRRGYIDGDD